MDPVAATTNEKPAENTKQMPIEPEADSTTEPDDSPKEPEKMQVDEESKPNATIPPEEINKNVTPSNNPTASDNPTVDMDTGSNSNNSAVITETNSSDSKDKNSEDSLGNIVDTSELVSKDQSILKTTLESRASAVAQETTPKINTESTNVNSNITGNNKPSNISEIKSNNSSDKILSKPKLPAEMPKTEPERIVVLPAEESTIILPSDNVTTEKNLCYCGKERNLNVVELQCAGCYKWFHKGCIIAPILKCIPFITNYTFICRNCHTSGTENFVKRQSNFSQICLTAIANLMQKSIAEGNPKALFSKDREIIPFVDKNWECLTTMQRRVKQTWHNTINKTMLKESDIFIYEETMATEEGQENEMLFGLSTQDLHKIGPSYESQVKSGLNKSADSISMTGFGFGKGRGAKRKFPGDSQVSSASKKPKSDLTMPKLPPHGYPLEHPYNKDGYRYILAEPDPHAPFRQEFDESSDWAGKPIPGWLFRTLVPNNVLFAMHDRAPQLKVSEDRLSIVGEKGYCMIRATHGISRGSWYFECTLDDMPEGAATRIGWSQPLGNLQAPLGYDKFSYSWRSRKGTKFHQSRGIHYSDKGYGQGDVIGCLIQLPFDPNEPIPLPQTYKDKPLVKFKSYLYFEEKDEVQKANKKLKPLKGSKITFFRNGENIGEAFHDIFAGTYYPAISLYKSCTIGLNCGPKFRFPPNNPKIRKMYEAGNAALIEQTVTDLIYFVENEGKLRLDL